MAWTPWSASVFVSSYLFGALAVRSVALIGIRVIPVGWGRLGVRDPQILGCRWATVVALGAE